MNNFDLRLLYVFDILYEERNVTRAATRLHLTQPAVSHALSRLRVMLEDPLFLRVPSGLQPTERAHQIAPRLRAALAEVRSIVAPLAFDPKTSDRHFTVGATSAYFGPTITRLISLVRSAAPEVSLQFLSLGPHVTEALDQQQVDVVLGAFIKVPDRFRQETLFMDELVWVSGARHPHADSLDNDQAMLAQPRVGTASEFIGDRPRSTVGRNDIVRHSILGSTDAHYLHPLPGERLPRMIVADAATAISVVTATDMVALLPRRYVQSHPFAKDVKIVHRPEAKAEMVDISMLWLELISDDLALKWLRGMIREALDMSSGSSSSADESPGGA